MLSGSNVYQNAYTYNFEMFMQEIRGSNCLNGGLEMGCSSGLISQSDWENGYGFIFVDLSRKTSQANDDVSRSVQVIGTNATNVALDIMWFIGYEREINLSTSTGALVIQ
jgi:hypothetical protein